VLVLGWAPVKVSDKEPRRDSDLLCVDAVQACGSDPFHVPWMGSVKEPVTGLDKALEPDSGKGPVKALEPDSGKGPVRALEPGSGKGSVKALAQDSGKGSVKALAQDSGKGSVRAQAQDSDKALVMEPGSGKGLETVQGLAEVAAENPNSYLAS
jgi:hypothetical protein